MSIYSMNYSPSRNKNNITDILLCSCCCNFSVQNKWSDFFHNCSYRNCRCKTRLHYTLNQC